MLVVNTLFLRLKLHGIGGKRRKVRLSSTDRSLQIVLCLRHWSVFMRSQP